MNKKNLKDILQYAKSNNLMDKSFQEVYDLWNQDMQDTLNSWLADEYLASREYEDMQYLDAAV